MARHRHLENRQNRGAQNRMMIGSTVLTPSDVRHVRAARRGVGVISHLLLHRVLPCSRGRREPWPSQAETSSAQSVRILGPTRRMRSMTSMLEILATHTLRWLEPGLREDGMIEPIMAAPAMAGLSPAPTMSGIIVGPRAAAQPAADGMAMATQEAMSMQKGGGRCPDAERLTIRPTNMDVATRDGDDGGKAHR